MAERIELTSGLREYELYFKDRDATVTIAFNPADTGMAVRLNEFESRVNEKLKGLTDIELDANGMPKDMSFIDNIKLINKSLSEELDRAFGNKISDKVFAFCDPLATIDGKYFVLQFIEQITPVMKRCIERENKALQKHIAGYRK